MDEAKAIQRARELILPLLRFPEERDTLVSLHYALHRLWANAQDTYAIELREKQERRYE